MNISDLEQVWGYLLFVRLLICNIAVAYDQLRRQIINELNEYVEERKYLKTYSANLQKNEYNLCIILAFTEGDQTSDYYYKKMGLMVVSRRSRFPMF